MDHEDQQIGIIDTADALARAREAGLDLVEVAPQSKPPVCRIMDYGKWKYAQSKKQRKSRAHRHEVELKEIRIKTPKIDVHDLMIKVQHARDFLERGDRVQFTLRFRGREL
ncbi:MAG: translation initiation factor IF-3, partial [Planctomycetota bacterium]